MSSSKRKLSIAMALVMGLSIAAVANARPQATQGQTGGFFGTPIPRPKRSGWVPQEAWNAIKQRAGLDLGSRRVKLYKSGWSRAMSRGLKGNLGAYTDAYVVHAKASNNPTNKRKGPYLAVKSNQGHYEVFPLALAANAQGQAARGKHVTKADARMATNNTYAYADGLIPGSKVVQAVRAKNTRMAFAQEGQVVASKQRGTTKTFYVLGDPNRQGNNPAAYARVGMLEHPLIMRPFRGSNERPAASTSSSSSGSAQPAQGILPGGCVIPVPGSSTLRTKFINLSQPAIGPITPRPPIRPLPLAAQ